ncbi:peptidase C15 [filamentous cyanobacterium LEGE 11480]|uniref:Peptidase C15 n=1 Tax=Romeriopsis navalis LEGE 11480 TaxID=2777977 RepID=A0A928VQI3_9CYAN|nr:peptidase C15 [Romeriopsis navalis]MBE9030264.1 peptidase C15 [Romeriopsis navalis LEGE 11480]
MPRILITTFQTWLEHQSSNSSDDLVLDLNDTQQLPQNCHILRQVPVDFHQAPVVVIKQIVELQPDWVVCCGMAESRSRLSIESNGRWQSDLQFATIDLDNLLYHATETVISHDAGGFVCNYLYYQVLRYLHQHRPQTSAIFVHVPVLNDDNRAVIAQDFLAILKSLKAAV